MARVTYGESITEYAGSIGGVTFLRNASGPIAKLRSNPPVNPSPDQSFYQTRFASLIAFWPTISQANKDLWDALAAAHDHTTPWGETKTLSGFQWFVSCNMNRLLHENTLISSPGTWAVIPPPDQFTIETSSSYIRVAWDPDYWPSDAIFFYSTLPLRQSSLKLRRSLFLLTHVYPLGALTNYDLTSYIESLFNVTWSTFYASANCSIILRLRDVDTPNGWSSAYTSAITKIN